MAGQVVADWLACDAWMGALQMHLAMSVWNKNASKNKGAKPDEGNKRKKNYPEVTNEKRITLG
ncbi:MAG: hypothetical protein WA977_07665 [Halobacteriota archaeon]